jgi:hypothetical protein
MEELGLIRSHHRAHATRQLGSSASQWAWRGLGTVRDGERPEIQRPQPRIVIAKLTEEGPSSESLEPRKG